MTTTTEAITGPPMVRFGRRPARGLILGFSTARVMALMVATTALVVGIIAAGVQGFAIAGVVWLPLGASAFVRWQGRPMIEWTPVVGHWGARAAAGQTEYRARPLAPRPAGTLALPGDAAALRVFEDPESGAAMVHDPHRGTLSVALRVAHPAYVLLAPDEKRQRVTAWGRTLASLAQSGSLSAVQVLEQTVPDPGTGPEAWYAEKATHLDDLPNAEYQALLGMAAHGSSTHRTTITISLDMKGAARSVRAAGRGISGAAAVLRGDMAAVEHSLRPAQLRIDHWLAAPELAVMIRQAYDPTAGLLPGISSPSLGTAGPLAISEHWGHFRHDRGYSTVLWISEWPRIDVDPQFLHAVVFSPGVRHSLAIVAHPLGTQEALRDIRKEKTEAITDSSQKAKIGQVQDLSDVQEYEDLLTRERALISGHADVVFSGFITVTADSEEALRAAVSQLERDATQSACETRVLYGQQSQAFVAAALPLARTTF